MVAREFRARADEHGLRAAANLHRVVGHQPMAPHNQIERALAFADAALADDEHAEPEDVHQHRVQHRSLGQRVLENRRQLCDGGRRDDRRFHQRQLRALSFDGELGGRRETAGDEDAGKVERQRETHRIDAPGHRQALEIADLALAENQHASRLEVLVKPGEREAGLLNVRTRNEAVEAIRAGDELERQTEGLGPAAQERADAYARNGCHVERSGFKVQGSGFRIPSENPEP